MRESDDGKWSKRVPFVFRAIDDSTSDEFEDDQAKTDTPTHMFDDTTPDNLKSGFINRIHFRLNPTNAVTYTLYIFSAAVADDYESNMNLLWESAAARADDADYDEAELHIPFILADAGDMYFALNWSAACGATTGFIEVSGETYE